MKKTTLIIFLLFSFILMSQSSKPKMALLNGPVGIGGLKMMKDAKYLNFYVAPSPDKLVASLVKGEYDIAAVPASLGAVLYNKNLDYKTVAVVAEANFSILSKNENIKSIKDLKGKTIYCPAKAASPDFILKYLIKEAGLKESDVKINYSLTPPDLTKALIAGVVETGMLVEPFTTMAIKENINLKIVLNTGDVLKQPTSILIAKTSFIEKDKKTLEKILKDYKASTDWALKNPKQIPPLLEGSGITVNANAVPDAIERMGFVFYTGDTMKKELNDYFNFVKEFDIFLIGGALPKDNFYYIN